MAFRDMHEDAGQARYGFLQTCHLRRECCNGKWDHAMIVIPWTGKDDDDDTT